jgi:hypothetical protein
MHSYTLPVALLHQEALRSTNDVVRPVAAAKVPESVLRTIERPGSALPSNDRQAMSAAFAHDFSRVRIHTDALAAHSAAEVKADAYSFGNKVVFGNGMFRPGHPRSRRLLAHELSHVLQQTHAHTRPHGIAHPDAPAERAASQAANAFATGAAPQTSTGQADPGLLHRQPAGTTPPPTTTPPTAATQPPGAPVAAPPSAAPAAAQPTSAQQPAAQKSEDDAAKKATDDLRDRVRKWLDGANFDLPLVADAPGTNNGVRRVYYQSRMSTLDAVTDDVTDVLGQVMPGVFKRTQRTAEWAHLRGNIWSQVWQYYNEKKNDAEKDRWQTVVSVLYTPQKNFWAHPAAASPTQNSTQLLGGRNYRLHAAGESGLELQGAGSISLFNIGSGHADVFQNALLSIQAQQVWNLGHDFKIDPDTWAVVQGSIFAQLAAGVGGTYGQSAKGERKVYVGFLAQPNVGGQVSLNIGKLQIIASGSLVFSYLGKTSEPKSTATESWGVQGGVGVGGQF